ncbi:MAG: hypothetical protein MZV70_63425 [Desulfobacterales bacterium]|nr:hypothetical protein [Desulfobacterales bacterium]
MYSPDPLPRRRVYQTRCFRRWANSSALARAFRLALPALLVPPGRTAEEKVMLALLAQ